MISIVTNRRFVADDSKYYILWDDLPPLMKLVDRNGGKVTPEVAKKLMAADLLRKVT